MKKENFIKTMNLMKDFMNLTEKLHELGIEIVDSKLFGITGQIFDQFVYTNFTEEGQDLVFWWIFEDVPKEITVNMVTYDVEDIDYFYKYLVKNRYVL